MQIRSRQPGDIPRLLQADGVLHPAAEHQELLPEGGGAARGAAEDPRPSLRRARRRRGHTGIRRRYQVCIAFVVQLSMQTCFQIFNFKIYASFKYE